MTNKLLTLLLILTFISLQSVWAQAGGEARRKRSNRKAPPAENPKPKETQTSPQDFIQTTPAVIPQGNGRVVGLVIDEATAEPVPGVYIKVNDPDKPFALQSDLDGKFSFTIPASKEISVTLECIGYNPKTITGIVVKNNATFSLQVVLSEQSVALQDVVITAEAKKESSVAMVIMQRNALQILDGFAGEMVMRETGGLYMPTVLQRLPGVALMQGQALVVRGLAERYNNILLNGGFLPVTNTDRQVFDFNALPASIVSQIQLYKSSTADMVSEFGGGIIALKTPDMPTGRKASFSYTLDFNDYTTFKKFKTYNATKSVLGGLFKEVPALPSDLPDAKTMRSWNNAWNKNPEALNNPDLIRAGRSLNNVGNRTLTARPGQNVFLTYENRWSKNGKDWGLSTSANIFDLYNYTYNYQNVVGEYNETLKRNDTRDSGYFHTWDRRQGANVILNGFLNIKSHTRISWKNLIHYSNHNQAVDNYGQYYTDNGELSYYVFYPTRFSAQKMYSTQIAGEHALGTNERKAPRLGWEGFMSLMNINHPFYRAANYIDDRETGTQYLESLTGDYAVWNYITSYKQNDRVLGGNVHLTLPVFSDSKIKMGLFATERNRTFRTRNLLYEILGDTTIHDTVMDGTKRFLLRNYNNLYRPENIGPGGFTLIDSTGDNQNFNARGINLAPYVQTIWGLTNKLKLLAGLRLDYFHQNLYSIPVTTDQNITLVNTKVTDLLPSASVIYSLSENTNLRLGYTKTVARPDARDISGFGILDYSLSRWRVGNPNLSRTLINSFDLRYETFTGGTDLVSVSVFYKQFQNPVEEFMDTNSVNGVTQNFSLTNRNAAGVGGLELEFRQSLEPLGRKIGTTWLSNFKVYGNMSLMRSRVDIEGPGGLFRSGRSLQGQSNILANAGLIFETPETKIGVAAFYTLNGKRILFVGSEKFPEYYEMPLHNFDIQFSKRFGQSLTLRLTLQNVAHQTYRVYQIYDKEGIFNKNRDLLVRETHRPFNILFTINYNF